MATLYKDGYFMDVRDSKVARIAELKAEGWSEDAPAAQPDVPVAPEKPADEVKPAAPAKKGGAKAAAE